jgi:alkanesulfonate monooxygenase SsuD/methylene tetrahydromethanopterin reductase-like flavin-dependent oxidoreductase (luciferase family)
VFVASNASPETVEYSGRRGFVPAFFSPAGRAGKFGQLYVDSARTIGHDYALGQNQALVRWMQIGETTDDARNAIARFDLELYRNLYKTLTPMIPLDESDPVTSMLQSGLFLGGTADEVRDQFVAQWEELPAEYCVLIFHYAQQPLDSVIRNLELFMEHVKPALDELTQYNQALASA